MGVQLDGRGSRCHGVVSLIPLYKDDMPASMMGHSWVAQRYRPNFR